MPPVHPALVHFPIALVVFSFLADLIGRIKGSQSLRAAAFWSLAAATISAILTVAAGYYDMSRAALGNTDAYVDFHMDIGFILLAAVTVLALWRWFLSARTGKQPGWAYIIAACLIMGLTLFQGWFGGEMVYSQGAGVAAAGKGTEPPTDVRLDKVMKLLGIKHEKEPGESH